jgi:hypothetical protein
MTSEKQIAANRANAQKSTGPRTAEGKAQSAQNALQHGMTATAPVLPDEDPSAFGELLQGLLDEYDPRTTVETELVQDLAWVFWRLRRVPYFDAAILLAAPHQALMDHVRQTVLRAGGGWDRANAAAAEKQSVEVREAVGPLGIGVHGFMRDLHGADMVNRLTRYETHLANRLQRILGQLAALRAERVEGEVVEPCESV